jgi:hypothetical protein
VYRTCKYEQLRQGPILPQVELVNAGDIDTNRRTDSGVKLPGSIQSAGLKFNKGGDRKQTAVQKIRSKN